MNIKLLFPPIWDCDCPYPSLAYLSSFLKMHGYNVSVSDLNIEMQNMIFSKMSMKVSLDSINRILSTSSSEVRINSAKRALKLFETVGENAFQNAIKSLKKDTDFETIRKSKLTLEIGRYIYSAAYSPVMFNANKYISVSEISNTDALLKEVYNTDLNIFYNLIDTYVQQLGEYDVIGISIAGTNQLVPAFTIAKLVKQRFKNKMVVIGGALLPYMYESILNTPELLTFVDCFIFGEGETPLVKWLEFLNGIGNIEDVSNIIYSSHGIPIGSKIKSYENINEICKPDYTGFNWEDYFYSERIITYISSRGCPWNKCRFCSLTSNYGQKYRIRDIDLVIDDITQLLKENHSRYFMFDDESITEKRLSNLSDRLIEKNIDIRWTCLSRLDSNTSSETFSLAYRAGLRVVSFGLESGSQKLLDKMNKGIKIDKVPQVLKNSSDAGIWNNIFMFFGFPEEGASDIELTRKFISENKESIDTLAYGDFRLEGGSELFLNPEKGGIEILPYNNNFFGPYYPFEYSNYDNNKDEALKKFYDDIKLSRFYHENYYCIDLKGIFILLDNAKKQDISPQIERILERRIQSESILKKDLSTLRFEINQEFTKKEIYNDDYGLYTYILYNPQYGISAEVNSIYIDILSYIRKNKSFSEMVACIVATSNAELSSVETYAKQVIYHLSKMEIINVLDIS